MLTFENSRARAAIVVLAVAIGGVGLYAQKGLLSPQDVEALPAKPADARIA